MVTVERGIVVKQERQAVVHPNRREVVISRIEGQAENVGEDRAAATLLRAGTMVWFSTMVMARLGRGTVDHSNSRNRDKFKVLSQR